MRLRRGLLIVILCAGCVFRASALSYRTANNVSIKHSDWRKDVATLFPRYIPAANLPKPRATPQGPLFLSLREAIILALRNNPDIQCAELQRVIDKFNLVVAHNAYEPQYTFTGAGTYTRGSLQTYSLTPSVGVKTPIGTSFKMDYSRTISKNTAGIGTTTLTVSQPLLKGFGWQVNMSPWLNALDNEMIAKFNYKNSIMTVIVSVITGYRGLVQDYQNLAIQKRTLNRTEKTVHQYALKVKYGKLSKSDLLQQKATYATTKVTMLEQKTTLDQAYQAYLKVLGLNASARVIIDKSLEAEQTRIPSLATSIRLALKNNIAYQIDLLNMHATERAVVIANDNARWSLDVTASASLSSPGSSAALLPVSGTTSTVSGVAPSVGFTFTVPLNDVAAQQGVVNAKINLTKARIALAQKKEQLIRDITKQLQTINNEEATLVVSKQAVSLQRINLKNARIKFKYGKTTLFEVNSIQDQLLSQETSLVSSEISLMNSITALNQQLSVTLDKWGIRIRY